MSKSRVADYDRPELWCGVDCDYCKAPAWFECETRTGRPAGLHASRIRKANRAKLARELVEMVGKAVLSPHQIN